MIGVAKDLIGDRLTAISERTIQAGSVGAEPALLRGRIVVPVRKIGTVATEVLMEPENRPYVEPDMEPGDAGTEEWADKKPRSGDPVGRGPLADPVATTDDDGVVDGSPADEFINDPDAVDARNDEGDRA